MEASSDRGGDGFARLCVRVEVACVLPSNGQSPLASVAYGVREFQNVFALRASVLLLSNCVKALMMGFFFSPGMGTPLKPPD